MSVKIGHASIDENGRIKNGSAGDQSGKEVCIRNWYLNAKGWVLLRCKDAKKRELIAEAMEKACANSMIGYDQWERDSLFNNVKDKGFDPSKTTRKVETDCSALVRVCIAYAYKKDVVGNIRTVDEPVTLVNTGLFTKYTSDKYCKSSDYLLRGDVLCTPISGHTVVVLSDGAKVNGEKENNQAATVTANLNKNVKWSGYVSANSLNVRVWAGSNNEKCSFSPLKKNAVVGVCDTVKDDNGSIWYYIKYNDKYGFVFSKYIKEKKIASNLNTGDKLQLSKVALYATSVAKNKSSTKTGTYYIWSSGVVNNRIRITNSLANVGKSNGVTAWINVEDAKNALK